MGDTTIMKVDSAHSPRGSMGQRHLAISKSMAMRLWDENPGDEKPPTTRGYETIGYVISGRAELRSEGQLVNFESWRFVGRSEGRIAQLSHPGSVQSGRGDTPARRGSRQGLLVFDLE